MGGGPPDTPLIQNPAKHIPSKGVRPMKVLGNQFSTHNFIKHRLYRDCLRKREDVTFKIFSCKKKQEVKLNIRGCFFLVQC